VPAPPTFAGALLVVDGVSYASIGAAVAASSPGDRIRVDIVTGGGFQIPHSLEIYGSGAGALAFNNLSAAVTIASGAGPVWIHDLPISNAVPAGNLAPILDLRTMTAGAPAGTVVRVERCAFTYGDRALFVSGSSWALLDCTFALNTPATAVNCYPVISTGVQGGGAWVSGCAFHTGTTPGIVHGIYTTDFTNGSYLSGHIGDFVVEGCTVVEDAPNVPLELLTDWQAWRNVAGTVTPHLVNVWAVGNTLQRYREGSVLHLSNDAAAGIAPLDFFGSVVLTNNAEGLATTQQKGIAQVDTATDPAPSSRPVGAPLVLWASGNVSAPPGFLWADITGEIGLFTAQDNKFAVPVPLLPVLTGTPGVVGVDVTVRGLDGAPVSSADLDVRVTVLAGGAAAGRMVTVSDLGGALAVRVLDLAGAGAAPALPTLALAVGQRVPG
jgi:hypothetical protein